MNSILPGAEPIFLKGKHKIGILCLHGFTGSPWDFRELGNFLNRKGFWVSAPLLAGHGTSPSDLANTKWEDWYNSAEEAYSSLQKHCNKIIIIGVSLGASLGFILVKKYPVAGFVSIGGAYKIYGKLKWLSYLAKIFWPLFPFYKKGYQQGRLSSEIISHRVGYSKIPVRAVRELRLAIKKGANSLDKIKCPVLLIQARSDHAVARGNISKLTSHIASENVKIIQADAYHVVIIDTNREKWFGEIYDFISELDQLD